MNESSADLHRIRAVVDEGAGAGPGSDVAGHDLDRVRQLLDAGHRVEHVLRMAMGGVHHDHVHAGFHQTGHALFGAAQRVDDYTLARLTRMMGINVIGSFLCAREAVKRMSSKHGGTGGVIVNLSSVAATLGSPAQYVDYAASKGAIDSFTLGLAREVGAQSIRVNAVRPGFIHTDIHARGGEPERIEPVETGETRAGRG